MPSVAAGHGDVTLEGLAGPVSVNADRGGVKADDLTGGCMSDGRRRLAHAIAGDLTLQGELDDVSISNMQGRVEFDGDFFGDTDLAHLGACPLSFHPH